MKKSLFALAAVGAIAGTAQAQSSVTVYGVIDEAYVGANQRFANPGQTVNNNSASGVTNTTTSAITSGAESTSRLGFKGNEDLGGGLSAFFTYEIALDPNKGDVIALNYTQNRQSFIGVKKAGVGAISFGTQYTPIFDAASMTDPGMLNNMMGNVIYDKGVGTNPTWSPTAQGNAAQTMPTAYQYSAMSNNSSFIVRAANSLKFQSESFAGFNVNAFAVVAQANSNSVAAQTAGTTTAGYQAGAGNVNSTAWGLGANYAWQKLFVTANYQSFSDKTAYTQNTVTGVYNVGAPTMGGFAGQVSPGTNDKDNQWYTAATYDFGILKAYVQYINRKVSDQYNPNTYVARTAQQIGVRSFITPTIESWANVGTGRMTSSAAYTGVNAILTGTATGQSVGSNSTNFGAFQLGTNYWLSKRTNLYAIYGQERTSNQAWVTGGNSTSYNANNYAVGVRHTF
jgi:predicted porin